MLYKYQKIYELLKPEIECRWRQGHCKLPTEPELREKYQVSISTIRQAVDRLENEGFLRRVQGSGCYINGSRFASDRIIELYLLAYGVSETSPNFRHFLAMTSPPLLEKGFHFSLRLIPEWTAAPEQFAGELRRIGLMPDIDCILTLAGNYSAGRVGEVTGLGKPVIFLNDFMTAELNTLDVNQICGDNRSVAAECVRYLEDCGHRRISIVTRSPEICYINSFLAGAGESAVRARIVPLILPPHAFKHEQVGVPEDEITAMIAELKKSSAVIFYGIDTCLFVDTLKRHQVRIPDDLSLLSADENIPDIDCVASDFGFYIKTIFDTARRVVKNPQSSEKHRIKLPVRIISRHTVKPHLMNKEA